MTALVRAGDAGVLARLDSVLGEFGPALKGLSSEGKLAVFKELVRDGAIRMFGAGPAMH